MYKFTAEKKLETDNNNISHKNIGELFDLTEKFFSKPETSVPYIGKEAQDISNLLDEKLKENHILSVGVGYPFYIMNKDKKPVPVNEIKNFVRTNFESFLKNIDGSEKLWICPECQTENDLQDLKTFCKSCKLTPIKPRTLFKTLPDIDIITVVNTLDENTKNLVKEILKNSGYTPSDPAVGKTASEMTEVLSSINKGMETDKKLPVDIHLISKKDFMDSLEKMKNGEKVSANAQSLRNLWENNTIPLWFDLVFSATNLKKNVDPRIKESVAETLRKIKETYGTPGLINEIKKISPRAEKILETPEISEVLSDKINSW